MHEYRKESTYKYTTQKKDESDVVNGRAEVTDWQIPVDDSGTLTLGNGCESRNEWERRHIYRENNAEDEATLWSE